MTTRHTWFTKTPQVTIVHDDYQGIEPNPLHPSACLSRDTSMSIRGWPVHYPGIHHCRCDEVSSNSATVEATKFARSHKSRMWQYIINACSARLNRHGP
jgi:hypothetical protein